MTQQEYRQAYHDKYRGILGRNKYSQPRRGYCFKTYSDGKYYSDCSSSQALTLKAVGLPVTYGGSSCPNTVGILLSKDMADVPVTIRNGVIQNPEVLQVGDLLLFAGTDSSRAYAGYVGHVEGVYAINAKTGAVTICGHGSGTPRTTELNAYCKSRYAKKTSTKLGHKGLIRVRRHVQLQDDAGTTKNDAGGGEDMKKVTVTGATVNLREGAGTQYGIAMVAKKGDVLDAIGAENGFIPVLVDGRVLWISEKYAQ